MRRDERGASLILAIAFLVVVGAIGAATLTLVTSGTRNRTSLDRLRDREYAADSAIEYSIAQVRNFGAPGPALVGCNPNDTSLPRTFFHTINGKDMRVDCLGAPTRTFTFFLQRNVIFTACEKANPDVACGGATTPTVIRAQVNYQAVGSGATVTVTRTWVQSWSVNR